MKRRIFLRVFAGYVVVSVLAVLVFGIYTFELARRISLDALTRGLEGAARAALVSVQPLLPQGRNPALDALTAAIGREGRMRLTVIDPKGVVLADNEQDPSVMVNHSNRPEVIVAMTGRVGTSSRFSGTVQRWLIYVAVPVIGPGGGVQGVVRSSASADELVVLTQQGLGQPVLSLPPFSLRRASCRHFLFFLHRSSPRSVISPGSSASSPRGTSVRGCTCAGRTR